MKTVHISTRRKALGLSLVEVLVTMIIGIIVLGMVLYTYIGNRSSYRLNSEMSRLQENGRIVMNLLEKDLRMGAYAGCAGFAALEAPDAIDTVRNNIRIGVYANLIAGTVVGGEAYSLRVVAPALNAGITDFTTDNTALTVRYPNGSAIRAGDYALVSDCSYGELHSIKSVVSDSGSVKLELDEAMSKAFVKEQSWAFVLPTYDGKAGITYKVKDADAPDGGTTGALTRNGLELTDGVEAFRVCFGIGNAYASNYGKSAITRYVRAEDVNTDADLEAVTAVQVDMLLASTSAYVLERAESQTFTLCGDDASAEITKNDRRARKLFSTTVSLRNKLR
jgi:type IV pilus assembly protein PilW